MRLGAEQAGWRCVFTCEWDRYAQQTYRANYGETDIWGDIHELSADDVPSYDVLMAGFPCQAFSSAGVSARSRKGQGHGFADETKGTLFFELARLLAAHRPRAFLLENVRGLVAHDRGRTFRTIRYVLTYGLGYRISWRVIPAYHWLPQYRHRVYIVGWRDVSTWDINRMRLPPAPAMLLGDILETDVPDRYTLTPQQMERLHRHKLKYNGAGAGGFTGFSYTVTRRDGIARTLMASTDGREQLIDQGHRLPRRLTPRECSRLMGFDLPQGSSFVIPVADRQAYRQFGNAVCPPVVGAIAEYMSPWLGGG